MFLQSKIWEPAFLLLFTRSVNKTPIMKTKMNYLTATLLAIFAWGGTGVGMAKQSKKVLRHPVEDNKKSP